MLLFVLIRKTSLFSNTKKHRTARVHYIVRSGALSLYQLVLLRLSMLHRHFDSECIPLCVCAFRCGPPYSGMLQIRVWPRPESRGGHKHSRVKGTPEICDLHSEIEYIMWCTIMKDWHLISYLCQKQAFILFCVTLPPPVQVFCIEGGGEMLKQNMLNWIQGCMRHPQLAGSIARWDLDLNCFCVKNENCCSSSGKDASARGFKFRSFIYLINLW